MGDPGTNVVRDGGTFGLLSGGTFALFDATEECESCCGEESDPWSGISFSDAGIQLGGHDGSLRTYRIDQLPGIIASPWTVEERSATRIRFRYTPEISIECSGTNTASFQFGTVRVSYDPDDGDKEGSFDITPYQNGPWSQGSLGGMDVRRPLDPMTFVPLAGFSPPDSNWLQTDASDVNGHIGDCLESPYTFSVFGTPVATPYRVTTDDPASSVSFDCRFDASGEGNNTYHEIQIDRVP